MTLWWPTLPIIQHGAVLSASALNALHRGAQYLFSRGREARMLHAANSDWVQSPYDGSYGQVFSGVAPLVGRTLYHDIWVKGASWGVRIQYQDTGGAWQTVLEQTGSGDGRLRATIDLTGRPGLVDGRVHSWRVEVRAPGTPFGYASVWGLAIRPPLTGWITPPTFTAGLSSASALNALPTSLESLRGWLGGVVHLQPGTTGATYVDVNLWHTFFRGVGRWKAGQGLYASVEVNASLFLGSESATWGVELQRPIRSGDYWETVNLHTRTFNRWEIASGGGEFIRLEAAIPAASIPGVTPGEYYTVTMWVRLTDAGNSVTVRRPMVHRMATPTPATGWPTLTDWQHGDTTVGPARLNAIGAAIMALAHGGAEDLAPEMPIQGGGALSGIHTLPWLVYQPVGQQVSLRYGANYRGDYALPGGSGPLSFDLGQIRQLPYGTRYVVTGAHWAYQAEEAYRG